MDDVLAIAALVQGLGRLGAESEREHAPTEAIAWSAFHAARDGLDAELLADGLRPARETARLAVAAARPHSPQPDALDGIERLLLDGAGADRRRADHRRGGMGDVGGLGRGDRAPAGRRLGRFAEGAQRLVAGEPLEGPVLELAHAPLEAQTAARPRRSDGLALIEVEAQAHDVALRLQERGYGLAQGGVGLVGRNLLLDSGAVVPGSGHRGRCHRPRRHPGRGWWASQSALRMSSTSSTGSSHARPPPRPWAHGRARRRAASRRPRSCAPAP